MPIPLDPLVTAIRKLAASPSDEEAWGILYVRLRPRLLATSYRILRGNRTLAEDATQEAFIKLIRHSRFANFMENPEAFVSYSLAVCRNISLTYLDRILREPIKEELVPDQQELLSSSASDNPESAMVRLELLARFSLNLDANNRRLLDLLLEGYNVKDIAQRLRIRYSAAAVRIHRLRTELHKLLKNLSPHKTKTLDV